MRVHSLPPNSAYPLHSLTFRPVGSVKSPLSHVTLPAPCFVTLSFHRQGPLPRLFVPFMAFGLSMGFPPPFSCTLHFPATPFCVHNIWVDIFFPYLFHVSDRPVIYLHCCTGSSSVEAVFSLPAPAFVFPFFFSFQMVSLLSLPLRFNVLVVQEWLFGFLPSALSFFSALLPLLSSTVIEWFLPWWFVLQTVLPPDILLWRGHQFFSPSFADVHERDICCFDFPNSLCSSLCFAPFSATQGDASSRGRVKDSLLLILRLSLVSFF